MRNAAIKRGTDITGTGQVADGQTCALAMEITDRSGGKSFKPFAPWLRTIFHQAEAAAALAVAPLVQRLIADAEQIATDGFARAARLNVASSNYMPIEVKIMALQVFDKIDLTDIHNHHLRRIRDMLDSAPPATLKISNSPVTGQ